MERYLHQRLGRFLTLYLDVHHLRPVSLQHSDKKIIKEMPSCESFVRPDSFSQR